MWSKSYVNAILGKVGEVTKANLNDVARRNNVGVTKHTAVNPLGSTITIAQNDYIKNRDSAMFDVTFVNIGVDDDTETGRYTDDTSSRIAQILVYNNGGAYRYSLIGEQHSFNGTDGPVIYDDGSNKVGIVGLDIIPADEDVARINLQLDGDGDAEALEALSGRVYVRASYESKIISEL